MDHTGMGAEDAPRYLHDEDVPKTVYEHLLEARRTRGACFIVLLDPDKPLRAGLISFVAQCEEAGVDAFFVGGSLLHRAAPEHYLERLRVATSLPLIGFPGSLAQLSPQLDAVLYLSVISGRNPEYLFGQHVHAAPLIKQMDLEPISTGYMLVESGRTTTAQYMSHSMPLPRHKPEVAAATALAAEMMGMRLLFADGGSGADRPVPVDVVAAVSEACTAPLAVGGGLQTPEQISRRVEAGAGLVVVGSALETNPDSCYLADLVSATHSSAPRLLGQTET